jgi:hypothetical protein
MSAWSGPAYAKVAKLKRGPRREGVAEHQARGLVAVGQRLPAVDDPQLQAVALVDRVHELQAGEVVGHAVELPAHGVVPVERGPVDADADRRQVHADADLGAALRLEPDVGPSDVLEDLHAGEARRVAAGRRLVVHQRVGGRTGLQRELEGRREPARDRVAADVRDGQVERELAGARHRRAQPVDVVVGEVAVVDVVGVDEPADLPRLEGGSLRVGGRARGDGGGRVAAGRRVRAGERSACRRLVVGVGRLGRSRRGHGAHRGRR